MSQQLDLLSGTLSQAMNQISSAILSDIGNKVSTLETKLNEIQSGQGVMNIKINDLDEKKLSTQACYKLKELVEIASLRENIYIFGPAGSGKTTAAKQLAEALGYNFGSICLTAGASETWLFGRQTPNGFVEGQFSKLYREGGVFLADEMDAADANVLISINSAIASDSMLNPISGEVIKKHENFVFIGAGNTSGLGADFKYNGRSRLDASTLTRFVNVFLDYDEKLEKKLCLDSDLYSMLIDARRKLQKDSAEEFISTRDFIKYSKLMKYANWTLKQVFESLTLSWSDTSKELIKFTETKTKKVKTEEAKVKNEFPF